MDTIPIFTPTIITSDSSVSFYVLLAIALIFVYLKMVKTSLFKRIVTTVFSGTSKFDTTIQSGTFGSQSILLQASYILLIGLASSYSLNTDNSFHLAFFTKGILFSILLFAYQLIGVYLFSTVAFAGKIHFLQLRLSFNELHSLTLFVGCIAIIYLPFELPYFTYFLISVVWGINIVGSCIQLLGKISIFHNILYLCVLEIIPVLFLLKYL